jgi:hypothetical protein
MSRKQPIPVDPELRKQLEDAGEDQSVEVVFTLRAPDDAAVLDEGEVSRTVDRIVKSAQASSGQDVRDLNVMPRVQSFAVAAPPGVVRSILTCPEIASAMANAQPEGLAIEPVPRPTKKARPRGGRKPPKGGD